MEAEDPDAVRLMTIHTAKGLEFPVVCVADLGRLPNTRSPRLLVDGERIGLRLVRLDGEPAEPALDYEELGAERARREAEEEDRIFYVAMTRARERLLLSGALDFDKPPERQGTAPISWLAPALCPGLAELLATRPASPVVCAAGGREDAPVLCRLLAPEHAGALGLEPPAARPREAPPAPSTAAPAPRRRRCGARPGCARAPRSGAGARHAQLHARCPSSSAAATATTSNGCWGSPRTAAVPRCARTRTARSRRVRAARSCTACSRTWTSPRARRERGPTWPWRRASSGCACSAQSARSSRRCSPRPPARRSRGASAERRTCAASTRSRSPRRAPRRS